MRAGRGSFKKLHADPVIRLDTFIHRWCLSSGFGGHEAAVRTWAETEHPEKFKSALRHLEVSFATPMTEILNKYRAYAADKANKNQTP